MHKVKLRSYTKPLQSYTVFQRFIKNFDNNLIKEIMKNQVKSLKKLKIIDNLLVSVDTTPILANTKFNNPKCFNRNKHNSKTNEKLSCGNPLCEAGLAIHKDGKQYLKHFINQKYYCPFRTSIDASYCPCNRSKYNNCHKNRGCVKYESVSIDY